MCTLRLSNSRSRSPEEQMVGLQQGLKLLERSRLVWETESTPKLLLPTKKNEEYNT